MQEKNSSDDTYSLGRRPEETRRLQAQAQLFNPFTRRLFEQAGIRAGMKVLEMGSGAGDVALLVASLVGPGGAVVGVEVNPTILDTARARVHEAGLSNVTFLEGDIERLQIDTKFDAIVGRLILMHLHSPAVALRRLAQYLRPGGIVAFQEMDLARLATFPSHPSCPLYEQATSWIVEAFRRAGLPLRMGLDLYLLLLDAGFPTPQMGCEALIGAGADWLGYDTAAETVRSLLPLILKHGIAIAEEVAIETLAERLQTEAVSQRAVVRGPDMVSAWAHKPELPSR